MKKTINIIVLVCIVVFVCACAPIEVTDNTTQTIVYDSFVVDMTTDRLVSCEMQWQTMGQCSHVGSTAKFTFDGEIFNCEYSDSILYTQDWYTTDIYRESGSYDSVYVKHETGETLGYYKGSIISSQDTYMRADMENPYQYAKQLATETVAKYIDVDEYALEQRIGHEDSELTNTIDGKDYYQTIYTFFFIRYVSGYATRDSAAVTVNSKGDIIGINLRGVGVDFDKFEAKIDRNKVERTIKEKISSLYDDKFSDYEYQIVESVLTLTPENVLVIVARIELAIPEEIYANGKTGVVLAIKIS